MISLSLSIETPVPRRSRPLSCHDVGVPSLQEPYSASVGYFDSKVVLLQWASMGLNRSPIHCDKAVKPVSVPECRLAPSALIECLEPACQVKELTIFDCCPRGLCEWKRAPRVIPHLPARRKAACAILHLSFYLCHSRISSLLKPIRLRPTTAATRSPPTS